MSRVIAFVACGFTLAACTASLPSMDFFRSAPPTETLRIESEPPGADARTSQGQNCRTPCELAVQPAELTVTVALTGYQTQTIVVAPEGATSQQFGPNNPPPPGAKLAPNPVYAELQVAPPPLGTKKKPVRKKKKVNTVATQAPPPAPAAAAAPAPVAEPAPAAATAFPWPAR